MTGGKLHFFTAKKKWELQTSKFVHKLQQMFTNFNCIFKSVIELRFVLGYHRDVLVLQFAILCPFRWTELK
ncbi:hypothetical protein AU377_07075 [Sporosarcina sp. HYO08]|nr:hypothetical protein AU377_07075 [Sporosarcina sp. HYO08]